MKSLTIFFLGTGHTRAKDGMLQRAYRQMPAAEVDLDNPGNTLWTGVDNVKVIFPGCGETDVTTHLSGIKIKNKTTRFLAKGAFAGPVLGHSVYKKAKKKIGGYVVGAGWDLTLKNAKALADKYLESVGANEELRINVIGHSRGAISAIRFMNVIDGDMDYRCHLGLEVNAYLNDPVGGPAGGGHRMTVPESQVFRCVRAVQMLVVRIAGRVKRFERAFYKDGVPDLKQCGFASSDETLIGEAERTTGSIGKERSIVYMPGTHGAAVAPDTTPQSKIGAHLLQSFLHHVGVLRNRSIIRSDPMTTCLDNYIDVQREVLGMATQRGTFYKKKGISSAHAIRKSRKRLLTENALHALRNNFLANYHNLVLLWHHDPDLLGELCQIDAVYKESGATELLDAIRSANTTNQKYLSLMRDVWKKAA